MTDLESLLERTLTGNAEQITPDTLSRPHLAAAPVRKGLVGLRVALAAAAVAAVAAGTALIAVHGLPGGDPVGVRPSLASTGPTPGATLPTSGEHRYVGRRWVVVAVESGGKRLEVPPKWRAVLVFGRGGGLQIDEPGDYGSGSYELTARGFRITQWATTFGGYFGTDPSLEAQLAALGPIEGVLKADGSPADATTVTWRGPRLVLTNAGSSLELIEDPGCSSRAPVICPGAPTP